VEVLELQALVMPVIQRRQHRTRIPTASHRDTPGSEGREASHEGWICL
jgi:hypothetical protein